MNRKSLMMAAAVVGFVFAACGGGGGGGSSSSITTSDCTPADVLKISGTRTAAINANATYASGTSDAITTVPGFGGYYSSIVVPPASGTTPQYSWTDPAASVVVQKLNTSLVSGASSSSWTPVLIVKGKSGGNMPASPYTHGKVPAGTDVTVANEPVLVSGGNYQLLVVRSDNNFDCKNFTVN